MVPESLRLLVQTPPLKGSFKCSLCYLHDGILRGLKGKVFISDEVRLIAPLIDLYLYCLPLK